MLPLGEPLGDPLGDSLGPPLMPLIPTGQVIQGRADPATTFVFPRDFGAVCTNTGFTETAHVFMQFCLVFTQRVFTEYARIEMALF